KAGLKRGMPTMRLPNARLKDHRLFHRPPSGDDPDASLHVREPILAEHFLSSSSECPSSGTPPSFAHDTRRRSRTGALAAAAKEVFGEYRFTDVKTGVGIVATRWAMEKPMIFKASVRQAHGRHATFQPGFGCTIAEAVKASCSAYPFFDKTF